MRSKVLKRVGLLGWMAPPLVFFAVFLAYPIIMSVFISLKDMNIALQKEKFVGLENYVTLLHSLEFIRAILRSFFYTGVCVGVGLLISLLFALLTISLYTTVSIRFAKIFRIIVVLPMIMMPVASSVLWSFSLTEQYGWVNSFIRLVGLESQPWLSTPFAFYWVMLADIWSWTPFTYIILLAGMLSLPIEPLEAAKIDGASGFQLFIYVTLPLLKRVILIALILKTIATFKAFDYLWIMTSGGGPGTSSTTLNLLLYKTAFHFWDYGLGCAMGIFVVLMSGIAIIPLLIIGKEAKEKRKI